MQRCIQLAQMGAGNVAPNPLVGAVLVYEGKIIGEGFHQQYGEAHAEVNCINAVSEQDLSFIEKSILYVSLEPCAHVGKTPACTSLIVEKKIKHVVIGCKDSFEKVNGNGIAILENAGVKVEICVLEKECRMLNKHFFTFYEKQRPYVMLKWAQSADGFIGKENETTKISNELTSKYVHKLRSETASILIGTKTALVDDPNLTTRNWTGKNPVRIIIDEELALDNSLNIFNAASNTIIINRKKSHTINNVIYHKINPSENFIKSIVDFLFEQKINSVIVEGGAKTIQQFLKNNIWDEAIIITNTQLQLKYGIPAPSLKNETLLSSQFILKDKIDLYKQNDNEFL
jgi:diaminohydroxyphosphoribosylaminopyrimidine deaminase / 5-amino-6-(5-phosphoribosylamino)uracil reductase